MKTSLVFGSTIIPALMLECGVAAVARELGIAIVEFEPVEVKHPRGRHYKHFTIGDQVLNADIIINLPKLKTHSLTLLTLAVKNLFGCIPSPGRHSGT